MKGRKRAEPENEIKLALPDAAAGRRLLRRAGFRVSHSRALETNTVFDTAGRRLLHAGMLLRVRIVRGRGLLTYKGCAAANHRHKQREELEVELPDPMTAGRILERLGFQPVFRYEKYRAEFTRPGGRGVAMLDETPVGVYLELEGPPRWIDRTARELGFSPADYIMASYGRLYLEYCKARGIAPGDMLYETSTSHPRPGLSEGRM